MSKGDSTTLISRIVVLAVISVIPGLDDHFRQNRGNT